MRQIEQLELGLWEVLKEAAISPDEADLGQLLDGLDAALLSLDTGGQLQVAAEAISQIAQVFCDRSTLAFEELEATNSDEGPVMSTDAFDLYVRQTMEVDFEQFIEPLATLPRKITERQAIAEGDSVVGELNRTTVLQVLDQQMSQEPDLTEAEIFNRTLALAHDEDVAAWARAISRWMGDHQMATIPLVQLQRAMGIPLIQLWLALLLGGYSMEQRGEFYETGQLWILGRD
ncbi:hypothetical protein JOY44_25420 (plasmid) [Phormidium sp. CLA17]|uniref:hypothetical protein n=1 Tax=Leptolyngbya sp. Cla-17 TaxID=2803751 RepID=UPI00149311D1|nr:hypothetical protein [Leptolyngbya sp. Cla-17]MBM0744864.1 hypothetical protein [Leptolyngbya sp. Cla-17]